jgi:hypothetical protein
MTFAGDQWNSLDPRLVQYLLANQGSSRFLVATPTSSYASLFILATDRPAMALGGYQGWDRILTPARLAEQVSQGAVRFFWINGGGGFTGDGNSPAPDDGQTVVSSSQDATVDLLAWVRETCTVVPAEEWQGGAEQGGRADARGNQLYDCAAVAGGG